MVDRYEMYWDTRRGDMRREEDGDFVSYSDYAKLRAENERFRKEMASLSDKYSDLYIRSRTGVVKVKALEWAQHPTAEAWRADIMLGTYQVWVGSKATAWQFDGLLGERINETASDEEEAKAAAQADYERRILSALEKAAPEGRRVKVPEGQTPLNDDLSHRLLDVIAEGMRARETGVGSPYHAHSLEHCLHATGWVQRDLRIALDVSRAAPEGWSHVVEDDGSEYLNPPSGWLSQELSATEGDQPVAEVKPFGHYFWRSNGDGTNSPDFTKGEIPEWKRGVYNVTPLFTRPSEQAVTEAMKAAADQLEKIAFNIPAPNPHTPQLVTLAIGMRDFVLKAAMEVGR